MGKNIDLFFSPPPPHFSLPQYFSQIVFSIYQTLSYIKSSPSSSPHDYSKVFLVRRKSDNLQVVIKQIPVDDLRTEERVATTNEVRVLRMLKHPNIVAHYDNFVDEKSLMIVMEYAPGGTLHDFIQERNGNLIQEKV